jgi:hypothetical protein
MDLRLYGRVLWRFRLIVAAGLLLALVLTLLSITRVTFNNGRPSLTYRQQETWQSTARIFLTNFRRGVPPNVVPVGDPAYAAYAQTFADIATSDHVRRQMLRDGPVPGSVSASPVLAPGLGTPLPLVEVSGLATTPSAALITAKRGVRALLTYVKQQQDVLRLLPQERVLLKVLNKPQGAAKIAARSKTRPVVVFLAAMMAVLGLVFVLENLRPRLRTVEHEAVARGPMDATRRSA